MRRRIDAPAAFDVVATPPEGANFEDYAAAGATWGLLIPWTLDAAVVLAKAGRGGAGTP